MPAGGDRRSGRHCRATLSHVVYSEAGAHHQSDTVIVSSLVSRRESVPSLHSRIPEDSGKAPGSEERRLLWIDDGSHRPIPTSGSSHAKAFRLTASSPARPVWPWLARGAIRAFCWTCGCQTCRDWPSSRPESRRNRRSGSRVDRLRGLRVRQIGWNVRRRIQGQATLRRRSRGRRSQAHRTKSNLRRTPGSRPRRGTCPAAR